MLELLLQSTGQPSEGSLFSSEAPMMTAFIGLPVADAAAGVVGTLVAAADGEAEAAAVGTAADALDDADFDLFFGQLHQQLPPLAVATSVLDNHGDDNDILVGDGDLLQDLFQLADTECPELLLEQELPADAAVDEAPAAAAADDDDSADSATAASASPASFEATVDMSPPSPTPSSSTVSSSAAASRRGSFGVAGGGRVAKKKEANREAAYRYRLKQRLSDSVAQERCAELQAAADNLAGRVDAAESEAKFLLQMCRQIFSSRKQSSSLRGFQAHE